MNDDIEPLLKWPNIETLWRAAMASLWNAGQRSIPGDGEHYDWEYEGDNPPISREESRRLAPALDEAVRKAADAYELPECLLRILDDEINAAARRLIADLPEEQRDKLLGAMKAANREPGGMNGQPDEEPDVGQSLQERFLRLADEWKSETAGLSSPRAIAGHPAYQKIIAMGKPVLPLIFRDMESNGGWWYPALRTLTGANPVPEQAKGEPPLNDEYWLRWAQENGYIQAADSERVK